MKEYAKIAEAVADGRGGGRGRGCCDTSCQVPNGLPTMKAHG